MSDTTLETVLRLVEEGHLAPEDAAKILAALDGVEAGGDRSAGAGREGEAGTGAGAGAAAAPRARADAARSVRIEITDGGRSVVNLRLPASLGEGAIGRIPGLSAEDATRIREALRAGLVGDLLRAVDEDGSGVRIAVE
jgi:hypothetical protein